MNMTAMQTSVLIASVNGIALHGPDEVAFADELFARIEEVEKMK